MPYISQKRRDEIQKEFSLSKLASSAKDSGELNYLMTWQILRYLGTNPKYDDYNTAIGAVCYAERYFDKPYDEHEPGVPHRLANTILGIIEQYTTGRYWGQPLIDILGAFDNVKMELYRRRIAGYEDVKMLNSGDVY